MTEVRVIKAVTDMHQQGLSFRRIAKFLDQIGVPTKCRGKAWHPEMVKRILAANGVKALHDQILVADGEVPQTAKTNRA